MAKKHKRKRSDLDSGSEPDEQKDPIYDQAASEVADAEQAEQEDTIQRPALDPETLKPQRKAIKDAKQAWNVYSKLEDDNRDRNRQNAQIAEIYKGRQPFAESEVESWQANFPTLFLAGIIDKVTPNIVTYIENAKSLTQSKLLDESADGARKSEVLRNIFTKYVRRWAGWRNFCSLLAQELTLIGYGFAARTDEYNWRPAFYRQDEAYVPDGTNQFASDVQALGIRQDFLIHELTDIIQDKEAAKEADWEINNCVDEINLAVGRNEDIGGSSGLAEDDRRFIDAIREGNLGAGLAKGALTVKAAHLLVVETGEGGKVSHWIVSRERTNKQLFKRENRFNSMRDVVTLFTFEPGNGKFYSPKGLGRMLANFSVAFDVVSNEGVNQARIAGLIPVSVDHSKGAPPCKIKPPFLEISSEMKEFEIQQNMAANLTATINLLNQLERIAQVATQQYIPGVTGLDQSSDNPTATEKRIDYSRELQSQSSFLGRFAGQFAELIGMMQRAMFDPETNDDEAKSARIEALGDKKKKIAGVVTEDELQEWALSPAAEVLQDLTVADNKAKIAAANDPEVIQSPLIDQKARLRTKLEAMVPVPIADSWLKPEAIDPEEAAEQDRQQIMETESILSGAPKIPVSDRDNHKIHLDRLVPDLMRGEAATLQLFQKQPNSVVEDPKLGEKMDHFNAGIVHGDEHVAKWAKKGAPKEVLKPYMDALKGGTDRMQKFAEMVHKMKDMKAKAMAATPPGMAGPGLAAPGQNGSAGGPPGMTPTPEPEKESPPPGLPGSPIQFTEKIATAWIGQFDKLSDTGKKRLEQLTGLGADNGTAGATAPSAPNPPGLDVGPVPPSNMPPPSDDPQQPLSDSLSSGQQQQQTQPAGEP